MSDSSAKLKSLFGRALDIRSPNERAKYLEESCQGDVALRKEIEDLIGAVARAGDFLEPDLPSEPVHHHDVGEVPGTVTGNYKLLERIGEGGMGLVYMAEQQRPVRRLVALKIVKPGLDTRQVIARFQAEQQALAMMDHANVAKVLDAGTTDVGRSYFVMELVKGVPITKYCDDLHLTIQQRLELFVPVCQAIQHAHQKGIIHRDIKPTNVLVALYDGVPVPKVIDFGVAKATGQPLTEKTMFTGFGQLVGTLEYMSPEQAQFNQLDIDTRSDIYSLGVLLYELLTGSTPFAESRRETMALDETLRIVREEDPPKPSTKVSTAGTLPTIAANRGAGPAQLRRQITGDLDWIVMKCLEKDRNRRYETASGLASDIQHYLRSEPVQAGPPSVLYRLHKFALRNKGGLAVAGGLLLAVVAVAASIGWAIRDRVARESQFVQAQSDRRTATERQVLDNLDLARTLVAESKLAPAREKLIQARAQLADAPGLEHLLAQVTAGQADLDRFQKFFELIDRANEAETAPADDSLEIEEDFDGEEPPTPVKRNVQRQPAAAVPLLLEALHSYGVGERDDWQRSLEGGFLATKQVEQLRRAAYEVLLWLADDLLRRGQDHRSEQLLAPDAAAQQAIVYLGKAEKAYPPTHALYALRARGHTALGDESAAQADSEQAAYTTPTIAYDYFLVGQTAFDANDWSEGTTAFEAALRVEPTHYWSLLMLGRCGSRRSQPPERIVAAAHIFTGCILKRPDHAYPYYCRAYAYENLRRSEEAIADYSKVIELTPWNVRAWHYRGYAYRVLRRYEDAAADYSKVIELDTRHVGAWHYRGESYSKLGQLEKALADYSKATELNPQHANAWFGRGLVHSKLGQQDQALAAYSQAITLNPKSVGSRVNRGGIYRRQGQPDKSLLDYSNAIELSPRCFPAWYGRGIAYHDLRQDDKAVADLSRALELKPQDAGVWFYRGLAHEWLFQPVKALPDYTKSIELDPTFPTSWFSRGRVYRRQNQPDLALADLTKTIELDPMFAAAWDNRGGILKILNRHMEAIADYSRAIELAPTQSNSINNLAWLLATCPDESIRDAPRAVELATKATQSSPKEGLYWNTLGVAHYRNGDWLAAIAALDKAVELRKGGDASEQFFLAMNQWKLGQHDEARAAYERAVNWMEKNAKSLEQRSQYRDELRCFQTEAEELLGRSPWD